MLRRFFAASLLVAMAGCAGAPRVQAPAADSLATWLDKQEIRSWQLLKRNISPAEPKVAGGPKPLPGIIVAGLGKKDPDYYFHWVRDSANVMTTLVEVNAAHRPEADPKELRRQMDDFLALTERLQKLPMGEPRFTISGEVDKLPWSRPQYDGPALRALAFMRYLDWLGDDKPERARVLKVVRRDLDFVGRVYLERGFDVWEEYRGDNYNTRLVQLVALETGGKWFGPKYQATARAQLEKLLDDHWDPARGFLRSQLAIAATDGYTAKKTDLDSAVIVTVVDVDRAGNRHTVTDPRVQATVHVLEDLFHKEFPLGVGYGRYKGDVYYGGNPWYLITAVYAQFYYRLARKMQQAGGFTVDKINLPFVQAMVGATAKEGHLTVGQVEFTQLHSALMDKGDAILESLRRVTPEDGDFFEQFDRVNGKPVSARGLAWAHSEFLRAVLERAAAITAL